MLNKTHALPTLFLSHGSPMTALEPGAAGGFMRRIGPAIDATFGRPKAILPISAHTATGAPVILAAPRHEAIYDFGGFDPKLRTLRYDAPGAPELGDRVREVLAAAGFASHRTAEGGLDHGIWTPLRYMYPDADIPVLPLAWVPTWSPERQFALGQALRPLADEGILLVGSGSITHNLGLFARGRPDMNAPEMPENAAFKAWMQERAAARDWPALFDYRRQAPHAAFMHPSDEHLLPWYIAAGAGGAHSTPVRLHESTQYGMLGMDIYGFGPQAAKLAAALG